MPLDALRDRHAALERRCNEALPSSLKLGAGVLYVHTSRGGQQLDAMAAPDWWDRWHDAAIVAILALQFAGLALVVVGAGLALGQERATALNDPVNVVANPGLNEFMPLVAAPFVVAALLLSTVVHEAGHAIATRRAGVEVREYGVALLLGVVPLAAYVLPAYELDEASRRARLRVFAAGATNNLVLAVVALFVLALPWTASAAEAYLVYFGWALTGGEAPATAQILELGVVSNLAFWTALLSANFGILNALPVAVLDGGRVFVCSLEAASERTGIALSERTQRATLHVLGSVAVLAVVVAVIGPHLPV